MTNLRTTIDDNDDNKDNKDNKESAQHTRRAMLETIPEEAFEDATAAEELKETRHTTRAALDTVTSADGNEHVQLPLFPNKDIYEKIPDLIQGGRIAGRRYAIGELLGSGGNGNVFDLRDNNFDRNIAVKMLSDDHAQNIKTLRKFVHEALITAQLDHPNILPVYDMDITEGGSLFYTMKKVEGYSLSEVIEDSVDDAYEDEVNNIDDVVRLFIKVCEAVSYAHARGIIHQDIKPSNIMLGAYGEVRVVDWGTAIDTKIEAAESGRLVGTPMYMSPEQARREGADERSDVYCLGASLFHTLTGRFPVWHDSQRVFWEYKKEGIIDPLTADDEINIPKPLIAIAFKCLDPDPADRYQSAEALGDDLKKYQAGLSVGAYQYSLIEFMRKWTAQHREAVFGALLIFVLLLIGGIFTYVEYQKELSGWGKPILVENFMNDTDWRDDWHIHRGNFAVEDGQLVTKEGTSFYAFYDKRLYGSVAIEFDGQMLHGSPPCDLSAVYISGFSQRANTELGLDGEGMNDVFLLQNGGYHNTCSMILGPEGRLDYKNIQLENGRLYKVRAEIDRDEMRMYLDGVEICSHRTDFPWTSGYIGIYGYFHSKAFDNIKIFTKGVAEKVSIMETADVLFTKELYKDAVDQYGKIAESHAGTPLAEEATYKQGVCYHKLDDAVRANEQWRALTTDRYTGAVRVHRWEKLRLDQAYGQIIEEMESCYADLEPIERRRIQTQWIRMLNSQLNECELMHVQRYMELWKRYFTSDPVTATEATRAFIAIGAYDGIPKYLGHIPSSVLSYHQARGEFNVVLDDYPDMRHQRIDALMHSGQFERILSDYADMRSECGQALIRMGRLDEAQTDYVDIPSVVAYVLLLRGEYDKVIELYPNFGWGELTSYILSERFEYFFEKHEVKKLPREMFQATMSTILQSFINGDKQAAYERMRSEREKPFVYTPSWSSYMFEMFFQLEVLQCIDGDTDPLKKALALYKQKTHMIRQRLSYAARLVLGEIGEDEFMAQPDQLAIRARYYFYSGIGFELAGDAKAAVKQFQEFLNLDAYEREIDQAVLIFARWRCKELQE